MNYFQKLMKFYMKTSAFPMFSYQQGSNCDVKSLVLKHCTNLDLAWHCILSKRQFYFNVMHDNFLNSKNIHSKVLYKL